MLQGLADSAELMPGGCLVRDANGLVLGFNETFARLCGKSGRLTRGRPFSDCVRPSLAGHFARADAARVRSLRFVLTLKRERGASSAYLVRQIRHEIKGQLYGWVTTVHRVRRVEQENQQIHRIAGTLTNRNFAALREVLPRVMEETALSVRARGARVYWKTGGAGSLEVLCRWPDEAEAQDTVVDPVWWHELTPAAPLKNAALTDSSPERCDMYPVHAQGQLLGALVLIEPREESAVPSIVATLFAGLIVRREIETLLNAYSVDLEKRVQERTTDLNVAYETLKQTQAQLVQAGKMASIGQLAAGVAHEINNPVGFVKSNLNMIDRYVMTLVQEAGDACEGRERIAAVEAKLREVVTESLEGIERIQDIVLNLRDFARIEEGHAGTADVNELIELSLKVLRNELKYTVTVHRDTGEVPEIWCRPERLNQVFVNLILNALHAVGGQGDIWITTGVDDDNVMIRIADNGVGMTPEVKERVFEPFFTTRDVGAGTGLGLSIVWDIISSHDGAIVVDTAPGEGTAFTITLPIRKQESSLPANFEAIMQNL